MKCIKQNYIQSAQIISEKRWNVDFVLTKNGKFKSMIELLDLGRKSSNGPLAAYIVKG